MTFQVVLSEGGRIVMQYKDVMPNGMEEGDSATIGLENRAGTVGFQFSFNQAAVEDGLAVIYEN